MVEICVNENLSCKVGREGIFCSAGRQIEFKRLKMSTGVLFLLVLRTLSVLTAGVPAPDDSDTTVLPPSLLYKESAGRRASNLQETTTDHSSSCNVNSEDLVTTARAAVTRVLKGMCCNGRETASNLDNRLYNLESQFADQMNVIKTMLLNMEERIGEVDGNVKKIKNEFRAMPESCQCPSPQQMQSQQVSSLMDDQDPNNKFARESEIQLYNSSIYFIPTPMDIKNSTAEQRVFTYYWRVRDMSNKLKNWEPRRSVRSPNFYISAASYKMYMRMFPRQNGGKNVYLHVGLTKGEHDATLNWPFRHKMRISVLDQRMENIQDINSRVWDPNVLCSEFNWKRPSANQDNHECVGLGFPQEVLAGRDYVVCNTVVVKLTVYLDL